MHQNPHAAHAMGLGPGGAPIPTGHYEFNDQQNGVIGKLAKRARFWGVLSIVAGVIGVLGIALGVAVMMVALGHASGEERMLVAAMIFGMALIGGSRIGSFIIIGFRYIKAAKSLDLVVTTQGQDVALAVDATDNMGKAFWLDFWIQIIVVGLSIVAGIVMFTAALAMA